MSERLVTKPARGSKHHSRSVNEIGEEYFEYALQKDPLYATAIGDHRYDHLLPDLSAPRREKDYQLLENFKEELAAINKASLSDGDHVRYDLLLHEVNAMIGVMNCQFPLWVVDQLDGPHIALLELAKNHTVRDVKDMDNLIERLRQSQQFFRDHITNLREGRNQRLTAAKINIAHVMEQLDEQLKENPELSPFMIALKNLPAPLTEQDKNRYTKQLLTVVNTVVYPALQSYHDYLKYELLPDAREAIGINSLPRGPQCYQRLIERHTGLKISPQEIHDVGLDEVKNIKAAMVELIKQHTDLVDEKSFVARLKKTPSQYLASKEALVLYNQDLVQRATDALPRAFGKLPTTKIEVMPIEDYRHKHAPAAYYYEAPADDARPAYYYLNTYQPEKRPLYNMAALAFHEAVPGHHLQIALANENSQIPRFQRHLGQTAFVEGWALYAELLSRELGLYRGVEEQFGSLSYELWRALRLVADTGIHFHGWTREKAIAYLADNSALTNVDIANEIDRYIVWPGQALAYKIGQMEFHRLRKLSEDSLKDKFSLPAFHDQVLKHGAVPMATLRNATTRWLKQQQQHEG